MGSMIRLLCHIKEPDHNSLGAFILTMNIKQENFIIVSIFSNIFEGV